MAEYLIPNSSEISSYYFPSLIKLPQTDNDKSGEFAQKTRQIIEKIGIKLKIDLHNLIIDLLDKFLKIKFLTTLIILRILLETLKKLIDNNLESDIKCDPTLKLRLVEDIYITIFNITLEAERKGSLDTVLETLVNQLLTDSANLFFECMPAFKNFLCGYQIVCWRDPETTNCVTICKVRSGIEFLSKLFAGIKINNDEVDFGDLIKSNGDLEEFDEELKEWQQDINWEINKEEIPTYVDLQNHWWWWD
jgi:hypothetical protein